MWAPQFIINIYSINNELFVNEINYAREASVNSPNYSSGDEEEDGSEQEGEALHEVQSGWVKGVEDAAADQKT